MRKLDTTSLAPLKGSMLLKAHTYSKNLARSSKLCQRGAVHKVPGRAQCEHFGHMKIRDTSLATQLHTKKAKVRKKIYHKLRMVAHTRRSISHTRRQHAKQKSAPGKTPKTSRTKVVKSFS